MSQRTTCRTAFILLAALLVMCSTGKASQNIKTSKIDKTFSTSLLTSQGEDMVAFRSAGSEEAPITVYYHQGLEVSCLSNPNQGWVKFSFLGQEAYLPGDKLLPGRPAEEGATFLPEMVVANRSPGTWLNLQEWPSMDAPVLDKYHDGALVTVYSISQDAQWAHVQAWNGHAGFMAADYLWNHSPLTHPYVSERVYELTHYMDRGLEARATVAENFTHQTFYTDVYLSFDKLYTSNDDIVGFSLYINDMYEAQLKPIPNQDKPDAALTHFAAAFPFHGAVDKVHLVAVLERAGENPVEILLLYQRTEQVGNLPIPRGAKPAFWNSDRAPKAFWEAMDSLLEGKEVEDLLQQYRQQHGDNTDFWPLEAQALEGLAHLWHEPEATQWNAFPGLLLPGDIAQEQALEIAYRALKTQGKSQEELNQLTPIFRFYNYSDVPNGRGWLVQLVRLQEPEVNYVEQYVIDAVDGNIVSTGGNG